MRFLSIPTFFTCPLHISATMNGYDAKQWDLSFSEIGQGAKDTKNPFKPIDSMLRGWKDPGASERRYDETFLRNAKGA
jgi:hypothetical protein